jgi:hypothetical protein
MLGALMLDDIKIGRQEMTVAWLCDLTARDNADRTRTLLRYAVTDPSTQHSRARCHIGNKQATGSRNG